MAVQVQDNHSIHKLSREQLAHVINDLRKIWPAALVLYTGSFEHA